MFRSFRFNKTSEEQRLRHEVFIFGTVSTNDNFVVPVKTTDNESRQK